MDRNRKARPGGGNLGEGLETQQRSALDYTSPAKVAYQVATLPLRVIKTDHEIQQRENLIDGAVVSDYAEALKSGAKFPPITVYYDGADHWLADGFHRVEAADEADLKTIAAEIRQGTKRDATLYACGANRDHGLRRSRADIRRAISTLVQDAEWGQLANRAIADKVGCDHKTVASVRDELLRWGNSPTEHSDQCAPDSPPQVGNFPNCDQPVIEEIEGDDLAGIRQAAAMMKGDTAPPAPPPPAKRTGRDGKSYPTTKAKPAPKPARKPAPAVNKGKVAMQAAHGVAAALVALQPMETDLLPEDARQVIANLRAALVRLEQRFGLGGTEGEGHA